MRDPERIDRIVDLLRTAWHRHPDLRLGQLVHHALASRSAKSFLVEDDVAQEMLSALVKGGWSCVQRAQDERYGR